MEEGYYQTDPAGAGEPQPADYDQVFPALPVVQASAPQAPHLPNSWNNKMRIGSSIITQVFQVPHDERRIDLNDSFGEKESMRHCANIMKETDAHIELSSCKNGSLTFLVSGKQESVMDARRKILQNFQTQASTTISIPRAHHKIILGKAGVRLRDLEKLTSTKISVPVITDQSDKITVQGTRDNVDKAVHEIYKISEEQAKKAFEEIQVEKELHPFIMGAYNEKINDLMTSTNTRIHVPPPSVAATTITISGEREGVDIAKQNILEQVSQMKKYTHVSIEVSKSQHKYVIGPRGANIYEILQQCGVSVEMPPLESHLETITLRGPQDKLGTALSKVYEKANSGKITELTAPAWINVYIVGKKGANIRQITQDYPKVHVQINPEDEKCIVEGPPEDVDAVSGMLNEKIASLLQDMTIKILTVDPKHFKHIIGKSGSNINRIKEQTGVDIKISGNDETENTIKIIGNRKGVTSAVAEIEEQIAKMELEEEKDITIDSKYHKVLIGHQGSSVKEIRDKFPQVQITFPSIDQKSDVVKLRGPKEDVEKCFKVLSKKVKEILENNSYSLTLPVYTECQRFIIGKGGANIRKLREETNTQIDLPEGRNIIIITGKKKENVEMAKERIMSQQQQQINAVTEEVRIPHKFYTALIGPQGRIISSIEEDCGVKITFPSNDSKSDMVTVVGPKEGVEKAKSFLLEQVSEREANSYTAEIRTNHQNHKFLIGKSGSKIKKIRESTGTRIIFPNEEDDKELITIIGKREAVLQAKAELEAAIEAIDSVVEIMLEVDPKHHKHFVARRCEILHKIEDEFGVNISFPRSGECSSRVTVKGPPNALEPAKQRINDIVKDLDERIETTVEIPSQHHSAIMGFKGSKVKEIESMYDVKIKMPEKGMGRAENEDDTMVNGGPRIQDLVRVSGKPENCEQAAEALRQAIPVTEEVDVPYEFHGGIIGNKGQSIRELMERYDVSIEVPKTELGLNTIKITGCPSSIEAAREGLKEKIKELEEEREDRALKSFKIPITVDPEYHPKIIGKRGATITKIKEDYGVQINIPRKGDPDEHIITITGYEDKANQAKEEILAIVTQLNERAREEVSIDSRVHSRLIGAKGRSIRRIMEQYGVEIKFPRNNDPDPNLVIISGDEEKVLDAKERLLMLEEEYLEDVTERERYQVRREEVKSMISTNGSGFVVKGAPWERGSGGGGNPNSGGGGGGGGGGAMNNAPDVASQQDFPSFQGGSANTSNKSTPWGPRR